MGLVPEKRGSRQEVRNAISAQFWEQQVQSARSLDGLGRLLPCEPPALSQTAPSGLSRTQQLLAGQALGLPGLPCYHGRDGGLVVDRVLLKAGASKWWSAVSGRARAQRIWRLHRSGLKMAEALNQLDNYGLCSRSRIGIGSKTTLNTLVEVPNLKCLQQQRQVQRQVQEEQGGDDGSGAVAPAAAPDVTCDPPVHAAAVLKHQLPQHQLVATASWNQEHLFGAGQYCCVPLTMTLDVLSNDRVDGLQYRLGLHHVSAALDEPRPFTTDHDDATTGEASSSSGGGLASFGMPGAGRGDWQSSLHVQGAVAVEGEAVLWKAEQAARSRSFFSTTDQQPLLSRQDQDPFVEPAGPLEQYAIPGSFELEGAPGHLPPPPARARSGGTATSAPDSSGDGAGGRPAGAAQGSTSPQAPRISRPLALPAPSDPSNATTQPQPGNSLKQGGSSQAGVVARLGVGRGGWTAGGLGAGEALWLGQGSLLGDVTAADIQSGIEEKRGALEGVRGQVRALAKEVRDGMLQQKLDQARQRYPRQPRLAPYSPWLAQPAIKVNAAVGCIARMPLPTWRSIKVGPGAPLLPPPPPSPPERCLGRQASLASRLQAAWAPYLRDTALRMFASAGISAQVGRFTRPVLDFSAVSLRLDLGLTSPHVATQCGADLGAQLRPQQAFALEGRDIWHALTLSATQQVIGPLRARADLRFALDMPIPVSAVDGDRASFKGLWEAARAMRPALLEHVYGLDLVVPGTQGTARAAIWYSALRKEAMAEVRLF